VGLIVDNINVSLSLCFFFFGGARPPPPREKKRRKINIIL